MRFKRKWIFGIFLIFVIGCNKCFVNAVGYGELSKIRLEQASFYLENTDFLGDVFLNLVERKRPTYDVVHTLKQQFFVAKKLFLQPYRQYDILKEYLNYTQELGLPKLLAFYNGKNGYDDDLGFNEYSFSVDVDISTMPDFWGSSTEEIIKQVQLTKWNSIVVYKKDLKVHTEAFDMYMVSFWNLLLKMLVYDATIFCEDERIVTLFRGIDFQKDIEFAQNLLRISGDEHVSEMLIANFNYDEEVLRVKELRNLLVEKKVKIMSISEFKMGKLVSLS